MVHGSEWEARKLLRLATPRLFLTQALPSSSLLVEMLFTSCMMTRGILSDLRSKTTRRPGLCDPYQVNSVN